MSSLVIAAVEHGELRNLLDRAADTLAGAATAAEILDARDQAVFVYDSAKAAARLAKAKGAHDEVVARVYRAQADALEIESLAKRRLADEYDAAQQRGEIAGHGGNRGNQHTGKVKDDNVGEVGEKDRPATAADAGISRVEVFEARKIRDAIEHEPGIVRRVLDEILDAGDEPTKAKLRKELAGPIAKMRSAVQAEKKERRHEREITLAGRIKALPSKKFGVILADPEWRFEPYSRESGMDRAPENHYPTTETTDIAARDVESIAADDCVLFLWATAPMLPDALRVMEAWGFTYKTHRVWHKRRVGAQRGTGYWFTGEHELLMVGTRGKVPAPAMGTQYGSVFEAPVGEHSEKPEDVLEMIEAYFPNLPKIELNRRGPARPGWDAWGLEAEEEEEERDPPSLKSHDFAADEAIEKIEVFRKGRSYALFEIYIGGDGSFEIASGFEMYGFCGSMHPRTRSPGSFDDAVRRGLLGLKAKLEGIVSEKSSGCSDKHRADARHGLSRIKEMWEARGLSDAGAES